MSAPMPVAGSIQRDPKTPELIFADERTELAISILEKVSQVAKTLPPEDQTQEVRTISFDDEHLSSGMYALLFSGTLVGTDRTRTYIVPGRSLAVLDQLGIPYRPE